MTGKTIVKKYHARRIMVRKGVWNEDDTLPGTADLKPDEASAKCDCGTKAAVRIMCVDRLVFGRVGTTRFDVAIESVQCSSHVNELIDAATNLFSLPVPIVSGHWQ
jgi:hypothetical protein